MNFTLCIVKARKKGADQGQLKPSTIHVPAGEPALYEDIDDTSTNTDVYMSKNLAYEFNFDRDQQSIARYIKSFSIIVILLVFCVAAAESMMVVKPQK